MMREGQKELLQCMGDILTLPTTPCTARDDAQPDLARVADSIQAIMAVSNSVPMALSPIISGTQSQSKTALGRIKTQEDLTQHYKVLAAAQHE
eukprot:8863260-Ditylum_brightwellii.AAC.1